MALHAAETKGIEVHVELLSGTTQKAQFLGIDKDSVSLGGYIKNQFTVIKIHKSQFKSIVDAAGNDMLAPQAAKQDTLAKAAPDSAGKTLPQDSIKQDTLAQAATDSSSQEQDSTVQVAKDSTAKIVNNAKVFVGFKTSDAQNQTNSVLLSAIAASALKEADSNYHYESENRFPDCDNNNCIQNEWYKLGVKEMLFGTISPTKTPDSLQIQLTRVLYEDSLPTISTFQANISSRNSVSDAITANKLNTLLQAARGVAPEKKKSLKSYIHVETDPEGATLSRSEKDALCKTPCTIATLDTGKIVLNAYWKVEHLWGAQTSVHPIPGDTVKVSLKLKRITPEVRVMSQPSGAEIFAGSSEIFKNTDPIATTPNKFIMMEPGFVNIRLRKEGYRDSLVSFYLAPVQETTVNVELEEINNFDELQKQTEWFKQRRIYQLGKTLMGSALAPVLVGSIFLYLAKRNYNDADEIKEDLTMPSIANGNNYQKKIDKNHDLAKKGDRDVIIGGSLIGTGIVLFGIGLYLTF